jgi:hypothetical protein
VVANAVVGPLHVSRRLVTGPRQPLTILVDRPGPESQFSWEYYTTLIEELSLTLYGDNMITQNRAFSYCSYAWTTRSLLRLSFLTTSQLLNQVKNGFFDHGCELFLSINMLLSKDESKRDATPSMS